MRRLFIGFMLFSVACFLFSGLAFCEDNKLPNVTVITTGGTIAEKVSAKSGGAVPALSGKDLIDAVPGLSKVANIDVVNFCNIDSSQMTPEIWANLSKTADKILSDPSVKGVVITHGTDTMVDGAYFLNTTLKSDKPVVFVGAMRSAAELSADGPDNILNAVTQVCSDNAKDWGVTVTMNQYINSARNVRKTQTTNVQTFNCGEEGYLGYIAMGKIKRFNDAPKQRKFDIPEKLPKVDVIADFAGSDGSLIRYSVDNGSDGIVMIGVGAGNVNAEVYKAIQYALGKNVPVVLTSRVFNGRVLPIYADQGGGATLQKAGVILGGDLTPFKARLLLMMVIPEAKGDMKKVREIFKDSL
ncbi:MAG: asparaginase [Candidatus Omnitrophica bacterium]|nr:asparaginase [Candidatus Omnitrophota bacterium]